VCIKERHCRSLLEKTACRYGFRENGAKISSFRSAAVAAALPGFAADASVIIA
jgi:hypothetical protein